jgi:hypothetical protein
MSNFILELLSMISTNVPQAAMKAAEVPVVIPFIPYNYCPWIVLGALLILLLYIFQR